MASSPSSSSSFKDYLISFADRQRQERLNQCVVIEQALSECERIRRSVSASKPGSASKSVTGPTVRLQDSRAAMKISRFYDWGLSNPRAEEAINAMRGDSGIGSMHPSEYQKDTSKGTSSSAASVDASPSMSCSREQHAVWGCRAMALGCASDLVQLKKCFKENLGTTNPQYFAYDSDAVDIGEGKNFCQLEMQKVGNCVKQNWKELDERSM